MVPTPVADPGCSPAEAGKPRDSGRPSGLVVLAVGLWFLADVTIGLDMPNVPWSDVWPLGLILIGGLIVVRGMGRRRA